MTPSLSLPSALDVSIHANLDLLALRLDEAVTDVVKARAAIAAGDLPTSLGTVVSLERMLPECDAILRTVLVAGRIAKEVRS